MHCFAGRLSVGNGDQASGRVDVPREAHNGDIQQIVAAAISAAASPLLPLLSVPHFGSSCEIWEKDCKADTNRVCRVFVRALTGKSMSHWVGPRTTGEEMELTVSQKTGVPQVSSI